MTTVPQDWTHLKAAIDRGATVAADLLRSAPDGSAKVTGLDWTVAELGAHMVTEAGRLEEMGRGEERAMPADGVAAENARDNATVTERDPAKLADMFADAHRSFAGLAARHGPTDPYEWFGMSITWADIVGIYLGELNVHAVDLARTLGRKHKIERADALHVIYGLLPALPSFVDPRGAKGFTGSYRLKLRGGPAVLLRFTSGALTVDTANGGKADCTISADPSAFLLVGYGRQSQWGPILSGKIMASGRKPWLGLKFNTLLANP